MVATLGGVLLGVALGMILKASYDQPWSERDARYVKFIGELFLNMLKGIIIPLIVPALIASIGSLSTKVAGKVGLRAVVYYMTTTVFAVILGITLVIFFLIIPSFMIYIGVSYKFCEDIFSVWLLAGLYAFLYYWEETIC